MNHDGYATPHWKADASCTIEPDSQGSFNLPVKALNIIWGNDPRFWQWIKLAEEETQSTRFKEGAVLVQVNWIEVTGNLSISTLKAASTGEYEIYYIAKFQVDAFGWHSVPIKFKVRLNGEETVNSVLLEPYREKDGVWHEISGGKFTVLKDTDGVVEFGMFEVDSDWWKGSMVLAGIKIKPKVG